MGVGPLEGRVGEGELLGREAGAGRGAGWGGGGCAGAGTWSSGAFPEAQ